jgi:methionyl-tRNA formyltransferase
MNRKLRIIYMGTPEFAVEPLRAIIHAGHNVIAVITAPDKPAGRGQKMHISPVKEFALHNKLEILQPVSLKDPAFVDEVKALDPNLMVVVAFRMLPEVVWQIPEFGTLNLHASLLPQYRGAAPINHAIINGETETGLTTFFIDKEIDTGKIILTRKLPVLPTDDAGDLHDRLMKAGGEMMLETLKLIENGNVVVQSQDKLITDTIHLQRAPKIFKKDCKINWNNPCARIHNLVRGLSPFPGAFSNIILEDGNVKQLKLYKTSFTISEAKGIPGTILTDKKNTFSVFAADGIIHIEELQVEGKKRMSAAEFVHGLHSTGKIYFEIQ